MNTSHRTGVAWVVTHPTGILNEKWSSRMWPKNKQKPKAFCSSQTADLFHTTTSNMHKQLTGWASASNWLMFGQSGGYTVYMHIQYIKCFTVYGALSQVCELYVNGMRLLYSNCALVYLNIWYHFKWWQVVVMNYYSVFIRQLIKLKHGKINLT